MAERPIQLDEFLAIPDALIANRFVLEFGTLPGGLSDGRELTIRCSNCEIPGVANEAIQWGVAGHKRKQRGAKNHSQQFTATFYETKGGILLRTLRNWHEQVVGTLSGDGIGSVPDYSVTCELSVFDDQSQLAYRTSIEQVFPQEIPNIQLDGTPGGNNTQLLIQVTFSYLQDKPVGVTLR